MNEPQSSVEVFNDLHEVLVHFIVVLSRPALIMGVDSYKLLPPLSQKEPS